MTRACTLIIVVLLMAACQETPREPDAGSPKLEGDTIVFPAGSPQVTALALAQVQPATPIRATLPGRLV